MISVVLASYNGVKFIKRQIDSIMCQLKDDDELIVSDDGSTDGTKELVLKLASADNRIKFIDGPKEGFNKNFENAINHSKGEYIFFSDQDDEWMPNKVEIIMNTFKNNLNIDCIRHDAVVIDDDNNVIIESYNNFRHSNTSFLSNIKKNTFTGCCMCVKREWLMKLLPFPNKVFYDAWIGILSSKYKKALIINDKLIKWCRHEGTVTDVKKRNSIFWILKDRFRLYKNLKRKCRNL